MFIHSRFISAVYTRTRNMYLQDVMKNTPKTLRAYSFRQEEYNVGSFFSVEEMRTDTRRFWGKSGVVVSGFNRLKPPR